MTTKELDKELERIVGGESLFPRWQRTELKRLLIEARIDELKTARSKNVYGGYHKPSIDIISTDYVTDRMAELEKERTQDE